MEILKEENSISQIVSEYDIHPAILNLGRNTALEKLPSLFTDETRSIEDMRFGYEKKIQNLYAEVGCLTTELTWLKKEWPQSLAGMSAWV